MYPSPNRYRYPKLLFTALHNKDNPVPKNDLGLPSLFLPCRTWKESRAVARDGGVANLHLRTRETDWIIWLGGRREQAAEVRCVRYRYFLFRYCLPITSEFCVLCCSSGQKVGYCWFFVGAAVGTRWIDGYIGIGIRIDSCRITRRQDT